MAGRRQDRETRRLNRRSLLAGLGSALALGGCAAGSESPTTAAVSTEGPAQAAAAPMVARKVVKVAMIVPLTGQTQHAAIAKSLKQAGELALFDRDDGTFQLVVQDDKGTPDGARAAAEQAIADGAELILGPLFATNVSAAAAPARAARIPVLAFSNDRQVAGSGVFVLGHSVETEVERVVSFAVAQGKRRIAALIPDDAYGHLAESALKATLQRSDGTLVASQRFPRSANGMLEPARQLGMTLKELDGGGQPADALLLPGDPDLLAQLAPLLTYAGVDTARLKILGTGAMDQPGLGREKMYVGAWFAAPDPTGWRQFTSQYTNTYGSAPPRIATLAYDAVGLAISLSKGPPGGRYTAETLTRPTGFSGVDGPVLLKSSGQSVRNLAVLEVQDFGAVVVDQTSSGGGQTAESNPGIRLN